MVKLVNDGFKFNSHMFVGGRKLSELVAQTSTNRAGKSGRVTKGKATRPPLASKKQDVGQEIPAPSDLQHMIKSCISEALQAFEVKFGAIVAHQLADNNKKIVGGLTKWVSENFDIEPLPPHVSDDRRKANQVTEMTVDGNRVESSRQQTRSHHTNQDKGAQIRDPTPNRVVDNTEANNSVEEIARFYNLPKNLVSIS